MSEREGLLLLTQRVITVRGNVDRHDIARLQERCRVEHASGATSIVIDFFRMTGCPSALLLALVQINAAMRTARVALHLIGLAEAIAAIVADARPEGPHAAG
jgi:anti-anti-sigma regulatory factor